MKYCLKRNIFKGEYFGFFNYGNCHLIDIITIVFFLQIVFEGARGNSNTGDIALDDVSMVSGRCPATGWCIDTPLNEN